MKNVERMRNFLTQASDRYVDLNGHKTGANHEPNEIVQLWAWELDFLVLAVGTMLDFMLAVSASNPDEWSVPCVPIPLSPDGVVLAHRDELRKRQITMNALADEIMRKLESKLA